MISDDAPAFSAWSLLSLTATAHGAPVYSDELGVRYAYDTDVPNGRYIAPGDLAVVRDDRIVLGAGWIDSIEAAPGRKIRYRCPSCASTAIKPGRTRHPVYLCACGAEFDVPAQEEREVEVFTASFDSRKWRLADRDFRGRHSLRPTLPELSRMPSVAWM